MSAARSRRLWRSRVRFVLDIGAAVAMISAAAALIWFAVHAPRQAAPAQGQRATPLPASPVSIAGAPVLGRPDARLVVIEFADFQCPYCGRFAREILPELRRKYFDAGTAQLVFHHFPLPMHSRAKAAAVAAVCAARQGRFWPMYDTLLSDGAKLDDADLLSAAKSLHADTDLFSSCIKLDESYKLVDADLELAKHLQVNATPTMFVGTLEPGQLVKVSQVLNGIRSIEDITRAMDAAAKSGG